MVDVIKLVEKEKLKAEDAVNTAKKRLDSALATKKKADAQLRGLRRKKK